MGSVALNVMSYLATFGKQIAKDLTVVDTM